jgi:hypothetical protein
MLVYSYIRYFDVKKGAIADAILECKQLPEHTKGEDIFKILDNFMLEPRTSSDPRTHEDLSPN